MKWIIFNLFVTISLLFLYNFAVSLCYGQTVLYRWYEGALNIMLDIFKFYKPVRIGYKTQNNIISFVPFVLWPSFLEIQIQISTLLKNWLYVKKVHIVNSLNLYVWYVIFLWLMWSKTFFLSFFHLFIIFWFICTMSIMML